MFNEKSILESVLKRIGLHHCLMLLVLRKDIANFMVGVIRRIVQIEQVPLSSLSV